jgi:hypothetical protein
MVGPAGTTGGQGSALKNVKNGKRSTNHWKIIGRSLEDHWKIIGRSLEDH